MTLRSMLGTSLTSRGACSVPHRARRGASVPVVAQTGNGRVQSALQTVATATAVVAEPGPPALTAEPPFRPVVVPQPPRKLRKARFHFKDIAHLTIPTDFWKFDQLGDSVFVNLHVEVHPPDWDATAYMEGPGKQEGISSPSGGIVVASTAASLDAPSASSTVGSTSRQLGPLSAEVVYALDLSRTMSHLHHHRARAYVKSITPPEEINMLGQEGLRIALFEKAGEHTLKLHLLEKPTHPKRHGRHSHPRHSHHQHRHSAHTGRSHRHAHPASSPSVPAAPTTDHTAGTQPKATPTTPPELSEPTAPAPAPAAAAAAAAVPEPLTVELMSDSPYEETSSSPKATADLVAGAASLVPANAELLHLLPPSYNLPDASNPMDMEQHLLQLLLLLGPALPGAQFGQMLTWLQSGMRPLRQLAPGDMRLQELQRDYSYLQCRVSSRRLDLMIDGYKLLLLQG